MPSADSPRSVVNSLGADAREIELVDKLGVDASLDVLKFGFAILLRERTRASGAYGHGSWNRCLSVRCGTSVPSRNPRDPRAGTAVSQKRSSAFGATAARVQQMRENRHLE